jgi:hypothetical protein
MAVKNMKPGLIAIIGILLFSLMLTGCNSNASQDNITGNSLSSTSNHERIINIDKLEIYHFHGTNQCYSCITVGDYAEATVNTYFADELESGKIVFAHINGELPINQELVVKYGATGSSLWLGTYDDGNFKAEQNTNVWYKIKDKTDYMNYLKGVIEQKLAGN